MKKIVWGLLVIFILNNCITFQISAEEFYDKDLYESALYNAAALGYIDAEPSSDTYGKTFQDNEIKYGFFSSKVLIDMWFDNIRASDEICQQHPNRATLNMSDVYEYFKKVFDIDFNDILKNSDLLNHNNETSLITDITDDYIATYVTARTGRWFWDYEIIIDSAIQVKNDIIYFRWHYENRENNKRSEQLYAILDKEDVAGKEVISYKYLSLNPPTDELLNSFVNQSDNPLENITSVEAEEYSYSQAALLQYAKNHLSVLYEDNTTGKHSYSDVRFLLADVSGDNKPELLAVGVFDNEMRYLEIYRYENGNIIKILDDYFGYMQGGAMDLAWYDGGIRVFYGSGSSGTGFLNRLMKYNNGNWVDVYNSHVDIDFDNSGEIKGYIVNDEYVSEEEFDRARENTGVPVELSDFSKIDTLLNNNEEITVILNGTNIEFDQPPIIKDDRTLVPLRAIFEALGATVDWNGDTKTVTAIKDNITVILTIGDYYFYKNGQKIEIDVPGIIVNGRTLVPVRAISEAFDCDVKWDGESQTVSINYKEQNNPINTSATDYEEFINKKINTKPQDIFCADYDDDGCEETFVFYKKKGHSGIYCDYFDFDKDNTEQTNIFEDKKFSTISFELHYLDEGTVLEMISDKNNVRLNYGFFVKDGVPAWQPVYGEIKSDLNMRYNWHMNSDKYIYSWSDERYLNDDTEEVPYLVPKIEDIYWNMYLMEVKPEFLKTFKNGNEVYNDLIFKHQNDKIQVLYSPDGIIYVNNKHYDDKNNRVDVTYVKLKTTSEKLTKAGSGKGDYIRGGLYPWFPYLYAAEGDLAYDYECNTSEEYDDDSEWFENHEKKTDSDLWIYFEGDKLELTNQVQTVNGRTMYPFRECLEFMGAKISWNSETNEAIAVLGNTTLAFKIGTNQYSINGKAMNMDVESYVDDATGALYSPIRYAAEALGYKIKWIPGAKFTTISITKDNGQEVKDYSKDLPKNKKAAKIGKSIYELLERQGFDEVQKDMNETSMNLMSSVIETDKASKNSNCILDVTHILLDGVEALTWTVSGNVDKGIDYINDTVVGMASDAITGLVEPQTTDEHIRAMCNSAFSDNMQLIIKLNQYHYQYGKNMTDRQAEEYLTMYHEITMNNRTLEMGIEYFNEKMTGGVLANAANIVGERLKKVAKSKIKEGLDIGVDAVTLTDKIMYQSAEDFVNAMFKDFEDSQSPALKSYAKDMKQLTKTYEGYLK